MRFGRLRVTLGALVTLAALAGCTSPKDEMIARGADPAYADGYDDGCSSGNQAGGGFGSGRKDAARFGSDAQYTKGWNDAFETCRARMAVMVQDARQRNPSRDK